MKGFYLAGSFDKGKKAQFMVLPQSQKPFRIDSLYGEIEPRGEVMNLRCFFGFHEWITMLDGKTKKCLQCYKVKI